MKKKYSRPAKKEPPGLLRRSTFHNVAPLGFLAEAKQHTRSGSARIVEVELVLNGHIDRRQNVSSEANAL
eukprot:scaffold231974_cov26-Tisochrysis_lutea.AAC.2